MRAAQGSGSFLWFHEQQKPQPKKERKREMADASLQWHLRTPRTTRGLSG